MPRRIYATAGLLIAVVSLAACTGADHVLEVVNQTPLQDGQDVQASGVAYWIDFDTDVSSMPVEDLGDGASCSSALTSWLNQNASRVLFPQQIRIANRSNEALSLSLVAVGSSHEEAADPGFYLQCGVVAPDTTDGLSGELEWHPVIFDLATSESKDGLDNYESAFAPSLSPGESVGVLLYLNGDSTFDGEIRAVATDGRASEAALPILSSDTPSSKLNWPGIPRDRAVLVHPLDRLLYCVTDDTGMPGEPCTPTEVKEIVADRYADLAESKH